MRPEQDPRFKRFGDQLAEAIRAAGKLKPVDDSDVITTRFCSHCNVFSVPEIDKGYEICSSCNKEYSN
jgi:hypothetical protein